MAGVIFRLEGCPGTHVHQEHSLQLRHTFGSFVEAQRVGLSQRDDAGCPFGGYQSPYRLDGESKVL